MKKLIMCLVIISVSFGILAQAPQKISYQIVVRDAGNNLVKNKPVGLKISILQGLPTGTLIWTETCNPNPQTNGNGLVSIEIGAINPLSIDLSSGGPYYLKTETDPTGGTNYTITGTSQLLSVPYALNAKSVTGTVNANNSIISNVSAPINSTDAANKAYVDGLLQTINQLETQPGIVKDVDGNLYTTIKIGTQVWMSENLKTSIYKDGTAIPLVTDNTAWSNLTTPGYCWYNNDAATYKATYGALYNWYTVNTGNLCPAGWHAPTDAEWTTLENYLIAYGYNYDGTTTGNKIAKSLTSTILWHISASIGAVGNTDYPAKRNRTGFTAFPGGARYGGGVFGNVSYEGSWWSATDNDAASAWYRYIIYDAGYEMRNTGNKKYGFYVRCVRD